MQTSTDLTIYEVSELKNDNDKTGTFKLVRKSLEGLPFEQCCPHSHVTAHEARICGFFITPKNSLELVPHLEAA